MRLLLDTCVALWVFEGSTEIPEQTKALITDAVNEVYFSAVSALEVIIKYQLGKLPMSAPPAQHLPAMISMHGLDVVGLGLKEVLEVERLPLLHRDPFDRLLIAQARIHRWTLVSPDKKMALYDVPILWM